MPYLPAMKAHGHYSAPVSQLDPGTEIPVMRALEHCGDACTLMPIKLALGHGNFPMLFVTPLSVELWLLSVWLALSLVGGGELYVFDHLAILAS